MVTSIEGLMTMPFFVELFESSQCHLPMQQSDLKYYFHDTTTFECSLGYAVGKICRCY
jgi:hypothetical protein